MKNITERISSIHNAQRLGRKQITFSSPFEVASNSLRRNLLRILVREGYLESFSIFQSVSTSGTPIGSIFTLFLKYGPRGEPAIRDIRALSLSSRRVYLPASALWQPQFLDGVLILSTPCGLLTDREARQIGVGGEALRGIRLFSFHVFSSYSFCG